MKKLTLSLLLTILSISVFAGKVVTKKDTLIQVSGTDTIMQIAKGASAQFVTNKETFEFNKSVMVNGDSLPTITRVKELIGDSMQTITGFVDLTSDQTITGIKTFSDTLTAPIINATKIYTSLSYPLFQDGLDGTIQYRGYKGMDFIANDENTVYIYGGIPTYSYEWLTCNLQFTRMSNPRGGEVFVADTSFTKVFGIDNTGFSMAFLTYTPTTTTISRGDTTFITMADTTIRAQKNLVAPKFYVSALNEAPASATAEGTTGEIRITAGYIYVCVSDDVWVRTELTTWP